MDASLRSWTLAVFLQGLVEALITGIVPEALGAQLYPFNFTGLCAEGPSFALQIACRVTSGEAYLFLQLPFRGEIQNLAVSVGGALARVCLPREVRKVALRHNFRKKWRRWHHHICNAFKEKGKCRSRRGGKIPTLVLPYLVVVARKKKRWRSYAMFLRVARLDVMEEKFELVMRRKRKNPSAPQSLTAAAAVVGRYSWSPVRRFQIKTPIGPGKVKLFQEKVKRFGSVSCVRLTPPTETGPGAHDKRCKAPPSVRSHKLWPSYLKWFYLKQINKSFVCMSKAGCVTRWLYMLRSGSPRAPFISTTSKRVPFV